MSGGRYPCLLILGAVTLVIVACQANLPNVDPADFACAGDAPGAGGILPCPEADFCKDSQCTPRFDCQIPGATRLGCDPDSTCELMGTKCKRCDLVLGAETAAVTCQSGLHTSTSARPRDLTSCACPDGTYCVAFQDGPITGDAYPLFVVPQGMPLPIGKLNFAKERPEFRFCVRVCGSELDCAANHTCRAAAVVGPDLYANPGSTRHTIGVCYPDAFAVTSTKATVVMPDPMACQSEGECAARNVPGPCNFGAEVVPDHPSVPAGAAWIPEQHRALIARCIPAGAGVSDDVGCTTGAQCRSGICAPFGRCARPCNPNIPSTCLFPRRCEDVRVSREVVGGGKIEDRVQICSAP